MAAGRRSGQNGPCSQSGNHFKVGVDQSNPNTCIARGREVQALLKQLLLANFSLFNMCWWLVAGMCDLCVVVVLNTQLLRFTIHLLPDCMWFWLLGGGSVLHFVNSFWSCCLDKIYFRHTRDQLGHATASKWAGDMQQGLSRSKAGIINSSKYSKTFQVRQDEEAQFST